MDSLKKLQQIFKRFPGIGERQAMRFAYFVATAEEGYVRDLAEQIATVRKGVRRCARCFALAENITAGLCPVCNDPSRDRSMLLVVEKDADRERFIQSHAYKGTYFLLGGLAPAIEKDTAAHIRTEELARLVEKEARENLREVILALSATPDGDRTEALVMARLEKLSLPNISISMLGKGLSTGTEIEYSDANTLSNALKTRTKEF